MIYTVTVNPSLDYIADLPFFSPNSLNRTTAEKIVAGGKGINVSIVLHNLGIASQALGFTAGFTGSEIERLLAEEGVSTDFIRVQEGFSRINVKMRSRSPEGAVTEETEVNGQGPRISEGHLQQLYQKLEKLQEEDTLVLAGSIPATLPEIQGPDGKKQTLYSSIMAHLAPKKARIVIDATRTLLTEALPYKPFLVKPNNDELGDIFGVKLTSRASLFPYAEKLRDMGAQNVLASIAGQGAVLAASDGRLYAGDAPQGRLVNSVGAGDSMVAGFLAGYQKSGDFQQALRLGLCAGSASACSEGLATKAQIEAMLAK